MVEPSKPLCNNLKKYGDCKYGDKCHFSHALPKDTPCYYMKERGICERMDCEYKHPLPNSNLTFIRDKDFGDQDLSHGKKLLTHVVKTPEGIRLASSDGYLIFEGSPPLAMPGVVINAIRYFPEVPGHVCVAYYAKQTPPNFGFALACPTGLRVRQDQAHAGKIVDLVYAVVKGVHCIFTVSQDKTLKVWSASEISFTLQHTIDMGKVPHSLVLATPSRILVGLEDGNLFLWDFDLNQTALVPSGTLERITVLTKCENILVTGDGTGHLTMRSEPEYKEVFPAVQTATKHKAERLLVLRNAKGEDWLAVSDS